MALIVENGTGIPGANSYVSLEDARSYAEARGIELAQDDFIAAQQLVNAFDVVEGYERRFSGERVFPATAFPRKYLWVNGFRVESDVIPIQLVYAQVQFAVAINAGFDLTPIVSQSDFVIREKVGPIETEYATPGQSQTSTVPYVTAAIKNLQALFGSGNPNQLTLTRC